VLCTFFWFATFLAYAWYVRKPSWKRFAWVVFGFTLALLSKSMAVTLPFTLLLLDLWPLRRITFAPDPHSQWLKSFAKLCIEKWPLFDMAALSSVVTYIAQGSGGAMTEFEVLPLWERLSNAALSYCRYIRILLWPDPLTAFYYHQTSSIMVSAAVLSAIALVLVTAACWHFRKDKPYCLFGWLWFLGTLAPVIGVVQVGAQSMAERYTYVPFVGLFIALVWLAADAVANSPAIRVAAQVLAVGILAAFAVRSDAQVKVWKDTITLFSHALDVDPRGEFPNLTLGVAYMMQGKFDVAEEYYQRALTYNPSRPMTLSHSAYSLMQTQDPRNMPLAHQRLEKALSVDPNNTYALANMAIWSYRMGNPKDEEMYSRKAIATRPDFTKVRLYLGDALQLQGKLDEAAQEYRQVIAQEPANYQAYNGLGLTLDKQGLKQEALKEFRLSLSIKPDQAMPHSQIGKILIEMHQLPEAVDEFTQAMRFGPVNANSHIGLGMVLMQMGDYEKAAGQFSDALQINPADADARRNLDLARAMMKNKMVQQAGK
jgi:tetratricopeptide (TPR) repeat protein